jgi:hypothetical protein
VGFLFTGQGLRPTGCDFSGCISNPLSCLIGLLLRIYFEFPFHSDFVARIFCSLMLNSGGKDPMVSSLGNFYRPECQKVNTHSLVDSLNLSQVAGGFPANATERGFLIGKWRWENDRAVRDAMISPEFLPMDQICIIGNALRFREAVLERLDLMALFTVQERRL